MSLKVLTSEFTIGPQKTLFTIHNVYAAPTIKIIAAKKAYQKFAWSEPKITINSPTKPEVPGRPAFARANKTANPVNFGIELITPP